MPRVRSRTPLTDPGAERLLVPRDDLVRETPDGPGEFRALEGPLRRYHRHVEVVDGHVVQRVDFALAVPWFGMLFTPLAARSLRQVPPALPGKQPWWAPPDRLDQRAATSLGLLCAISLAVGYLNTLFTQTVAFAADEFGVGTGAQGVAGTVVRCGIVLSVGLTFLADKRGRRQMLLVAAFAAPIVSALGALAPGFWTLTATQTVGRPMAITVGLLVGVVAAEEMPRSSRAYAISVLAMATGFGAGLCLLALPLADLGVQGWRLVYVVPLVFLVVAVDLRRRLPESRRFELPHAAAPVFPRRRFVLLAASGFLVNLLVAPASFFQNRYLKDVRNYSAAQISAFTLATNTPGGIGIVVGGHLADVHGRRVVGAVGLFVGAVATVVQFWVGGSAMWLASTVGAVVGAAAVPALGVYGAELFPTGNRGRASGLISALSLIGSSLGLLLVGWLVSRGWDYGPAIGLMATGPVVVALLVLTLYPETAHRELEDLNPEDRAAGAPSGALPGSPVPSDVTEEVGDH
jgi:MFS family permease